VAGSGAGGPERLLYRVFRVDVKQGHDWKAYARNLIVFSVIGWLVLYFVLRSRRCGTSPA
jgi:K+-transporting ATPase A subunit